MICFKYDPSYVNNFHILFSTYIRRSGKWYFETSYYLLKCSSNHFNMVNLVAADAAAYSFEGISTTDDGT